MTSVLRTSLLLLALMLSSGKMPSEAGRNNPVDSGRPHPVSAAHLYWTPQTPDDPKFDAPNAGAHIPDNKTPALEACRVGPTTSIGTAWPLENGYVVTNYHVVAGSTELSLQNISGQKYKAKPVLVDPSSDLAILAVDNTCQLPPALPLCNIEAPSGTSVFTLGFPRVDTLGYSPKYTDGLISNDTTSLGNTNRYVTTVQIQPGNSGGPLLNTNGEVVGIVTAMLGVQNKSTGAIKLLPNQSSAVKIGRLRRLMERLPDNGVHEQTHAEPGLPLQTLCDQLKDSMLIVIVQREYDG